MAQAQPVLKLTSDKNENGDITTGAEGIGLYNNARVVAAAKIHLKISLTH